ncbi:MAG: ATP-binding protein [Promethearchaeia archaeon]
MISTFIDREDELSLLQREWASDKASLIILHGRRRIGKTRLLMEFYKDKPGIFYMAEQASKLIQINGLKQKMANFLNDNLLESLEIKEWNQLFEYFGKNAPNERFYLVVDEFTYLIETEKRIVSILQKHWDLSFSGSKIQIILSGSLLGLMNEQVLSQRSPLYGRRTRDILLGSLEFRDAAQFLSMDSEEQLKTYLIIGGIPEYLLKASSYKSLSAFLSQEFFHKQGYFFREPYYILSQEIRKLKIYFSILNAIAFGNTRPTRIANFVGIRSREIYPYLDTLIRLGFIERETPILLSSNRGIYLIKDDVFDFWFNFIFNHREKIERNAFMPPHEILSPFFGKKYERFCRKEFIPRIFSDYTQIGRWWYKDKEIDIVGVDKEQEEILFIECKWSELKERDIEDILQDLKEKAKSVQWKNTTRSETYGVLGREIKEKEELGDKGVLLFDLRDIIENGEGK